jgi:hydrogenase maturation protease
MNNLNKENVVLIGIGNNLLTDDGVGPFLAKDIGQKLGFPFKFVTHLSLDLLEHILGLQFIYIIDSFRNPEIPVGEVVPFTMDDLEYRQNPTYSHGVTIPIIFKIGKRLYPNMSANVRIFGINVSDNQTVSESFSEEINHKMDKISNYLLKKIQNDAGGKL